MLFADTLRANLDPFDKYTDNDVWKCLESAHLKEYVLSLDDQLNHQIAEGGDNLRFVLTILFACRLNCAVKSLSQLFDINTHIQIYTCIYSLQNYVGVNSLS